MNNIVIGARCDLITFKRGIGAIHGTISITRGKTNLLQKKDFAPIFVGSIQIYSEVLGPEGGQLKVW